MLKEIKQNKNSTGVSKNKIQQQDFGLQSNNKNKPQN